MIPPNLHPKTNATLIPCVFLHQLQRQGQPMCGQLSYSSNHLARCAMCPPCLHLPHSNSESSFSIFLQQISHTTGASPLLFHSLMRSSATLTHSRKLAALRPRRSSSLTLLLSRLHLQFQKRYSQPCSPAIYRACRNCSRYLRSEGNSSASPATVSKSSFSSRYSRQMSSIRSSLPLPTGAAVQQRMFSSRGNRHSRSYNSPHNSLRLLSPSSRAAKLSRSERRRSRRKRSRRQSCSCEREAPSWSQELPSSLKASCRYPSCTDGRYVPANLTKQSKLVLRISTFRGILRISWKRARASSSKTLMNDPLPPTLSDDIFMATISKVGRPMKCSTSCLSSSASRLHIERNPLRIYSRGAEQGALGVAATASRALPQRRSSRSQTRLAVRSSGGGFSQKQSSLLSQLLRQQAPVDSLSMEYPLRLRRLLLLSSSVQYCALNLRTPFSCISFVEQKDCKAKERSSPARRTTAM